MAQTNSPSVITIRLHSPVTRLLLLIPILLAMLGAWFAVRWYVGDTLSEYTSNAQQDSLDQARVAARWAPDDAYVHWRIGALAQKEFSANNLAEAVHEFQTAVSLSPNDYRYWVELGRALEASGDAASGERALRRAVELAPAYSQPRWFFGNLLVRQGKFDEAFRELLHAADADESLRPQIFNLAWQVFDGDIDAIAKVACPTPATRALFAIYLVKPNKIPDAMRIWSAISLQDRKELKDLGDTLKNSLIAASRFHEALNVTRDIQPDGGEALPNEEFHNGGFETNLSLPSTKSFGWVIGSNPQAQFAIDSRGHSGRRSLRMVFKAPNKLDAIPVAQTVVVEPNTQYRMEFFARTEDLSSGSTPYAAILDATDNVPLAISPPLPTGTNDWQRIVLEFRTKPKRDGVTLTLGRAACTVGDVCPIFGTIWYDDFNLQRIGGPATSR